MKIDRTGEGKELYKNNKKLFEGKYLNGKIWNGKGYNIDGNLEYIINNGAGKVKEYNYEGDLEFEGDYLNGEKNGKGNEYNNGKLIFEGEYLFGKRRNGKEYNNDK